MATLQTSACWRWSRLRIVLAILAALALLPVVLGLYVWWWARVLTHIGLLEQLMPRVF